MIKQGAKTCNTLGPLRGSATKTSTKRNPGNIIFNKTGKHDVILKVTDKAGNVSAAKKIVVTVTEDELYIDPRLSDDLGAYVSDTYVQSFGNQNKVRVSRLADNKVLVENLGPEPYIPESLSPLELTFVSERRENLILIRIQASSLFLKQMLRVQFS